MLSCILKYELMTLPITFSPLALLPLSIIRNQDQPVTLIWWLLFWKLQEGKSTWPTFSLRLFLLQPERKKKKKIRVHNRTIVFPAPPTPLFSGLCNQLWQHLKMLISQILKLLIPENCTWMTFFPFLHICG